MPRACPFFRRLAPPPSGRLSSSTRFGRGCFCSSPSRNASGSLPAAAASSSTKDSMMNPVMRRADGAPEAHGHRRSMRTYFGQDVRDLVLQVRNALDRGVVDAPFFIIDGKTPAKDGGANDLWDHAVTRPFSSRPASIRVIVAGGRSRSGNPLPASR